MRNEVISNNYFILDNTIWIFLFNERSNAMNKLKESFIDAIEKLQDEYGACKINTKEFTEGLNKLGIYTAEEVDGHLATAEDARVQYKMDNKQFEPTTTVIPIPEEK